MFTQVSGTSSTKIQLMSITPATWIVLLLAGCSFQDEAHWSDQLSPSGPCWEVNLIDGIDDSSTAEMHDLFDCLNQSGGFDPLVEVVQSIDSSTRFGEPAGLAAARLSNALPGSGFNVFSVVERTLRLISEFIDEAETIQSAVVELMYGKIRERIDVDVDRTEAGVIAPLISLSETIAAPMLDSPEASRQELKDIADSQVFAEAVCSLTATVTSSDPLISQLPQDFLLHFGEAWTSAADDENNIHASPTGHSIRDLIDWLSVGSTQSRFQPVLPDIHAMFSDAQVQQRTEDVLRDAASDGRLEGLPNQILYLASVDADGREVGSGAASELSALQASMRMLHNANQEMVCTIPIVGIDIELGNLSVEILREVASTEPGTFVQRLDLLQGVWGLDVTQAIAEGVAESGACPVFNAQLLEDMEVIERLNDPPVEDLAIIVHGFLNSVYVSGQVDRLEELVNVGAFLHESGAIAPMEEVLRDVASQKLTNDLIALISTIFDDGTLSAEACSPGVEPLSFESLWDFGTHISDPEFDSVLIDDVGLVMIDEPALWHALDRVAILSSTPDAHIRDIPRLLIDWVLLEGADTLLDGMVVFLDHETAYVDALSLAEHQPMTEAMTHVTEDGQGPLPFVGQLILSDTVTVMLQTLNLVLDSLGAYESQTN